MYFAGFCRLVTLNPKSKDPRAKTSAFSDETQMPKQLAGPRNSCIVQFSSGCQNSTVVGAMGFGSIVLVGRFRALQFTWETCLIEVFSFLASYENCLIPDF